VLAATFAVLAVLPLTALLGLGIIVSVGVVIDTLVIRTLPVPALSIDAHRRIRWLGRLATTSVGRHEAAPELLGSR
jgi:RND superfamily putative drug exporter